MSEIKVKLGREIIAKNVNIELNIQSDIFYFLYITDPKTGKELRKLCIKIERSRFNGSGLKCEVVKQEYH